MSLEHKELEAIYDRLQRKAEDIEIDEDKTTLYIVGAGATAIVLGYGWNSVAMATPDERLIGTCIEMPRHPSCVTGSVEQQQSLATPNELTFMEAPSYVVTALGVVALFTAGYRFWRRNNDPEQRYFKPSLKS